MSLCSPEQPLPDINFQFNSIQVLLTLPTNNQPSRSPHFKVVLTLAVTTFILDLMMTSLSAIG
jgi:hypothetical protein